MGASDSVATAWAKTSPGTRHTTQGEVVVTVAVRGRPCSTPISPSTSGPPLQQWSRVLRHQYPALVPREPYEATGRWAEYGDNVFRLQDRKRADYLLAPTHEQMFTVLVGHPGRPP